MDRQAAARTEKSEKAGHMVTRLRHIDRIRGSAGKHVLIAGSYHAARILREYEIPHEVPGAAMSEHDKQSILGQTAAVAGLVDDALSERGVSDSLRATAVAKTVVTVFHFLGSAFAERATDTRLAHIDGGDPFFAWFADNLLPPYKASKGHEAPANRLWLLNRLFDDFELDFRSWTGIKIDKSPMRSRLVRLEVRQDGMSGLGNWRMNLARALRSELSGRKPVEIFIDRPVPAVLPPEIESLTLDRIEDDHGKALADIAARTVELATREFLDNYAALTAILPAVRNSPKSGRFNNVGRVSYAAFATALSERDVPTSLISHGAMVAHGPSPRVTAARFLSRAIFNDHPAMTTLLPRSPLQVGEHSRHAKIVRDVRVVDLPDVSEGALAEDRSFVVLYAPNFLAWHAGNHGLSTTCFETRVCAEELVGAMRGRRGYETLIRVKRTPVDKAPKRKPRLSTKLGLAPGDLDDLMDPSAGIHDVSFGSHNAVMDKADLVVTEGVTAVMFEALELRKPVLLLNQDPARIPSLPAWSTRDLAQNPGRNAVYSASTADDLAEVIGRIRERHMNRPLTDGELERYVWVK